jgi:hypothetical protein
MQSCPTYYADLGFKEIFLSDLSEFVCNLIFSIFFENCDQNQKKHGEN